jgi:hypothetical protein
MKPPDAVATRHGSQPFAQPRIARRRVDDAAQQSSEVEPRAAHDQRHATPGHDPSDGRLGLTDEVGQVEVAAGIMMVDEMVPDAPPLSRRGLGGGAVETAVNLQGVAADHLAADPLGQSDGDPRLPRTGGTEDDQQAQTGPPWRVISSVRPRIRS